MTNGLVGYPAIGDFLRVAKVTSGVSIEIGTQVGFEAIHVRKNWIERIGRDTIIVEEPSLLAIFPYRLFATYFKTSDL